MNNKAADLSTKEQLLAFVNDLRCIQCDHYVDGQWSSFDGKVYCQDCWDFNRSEEERIKQEEIDKLLSRLTILGVDISPLRVSAPDSTE